MVVWFSISLSDNIKPIVTAHSSRLAWLLAETTPAKPQEKSLELKDFENKIKRVLSTSVAIKGNDKKGKIVIDYYSIDDLNRIYDILLSLNQ